ncbi:MAG: hypothetical protein WA632_05875 [Gallionella sp.]
MQQIATTFAGTPLFALANAQAVTINHRCSNTSGHSSGQVTLTLPVQKARLANRVAQPYAMISTGITIRKIIARLTFRALFPSLRAGKQIFEDQAVAP